MVYAEIRSKDKKRYIRIDKSDDDLEWWLERIEDHFKNEEISEREKADIKDWARTATVGDNCSNGEMTVRVLEDVG